MRKIFSLIAVMLFALAANADPVVLPATLDVDNVSFRSANMPDYIITEGDTAGTYFDMGAHDSSNDTLLYAEWDVTIEAKKYNLAVDVYNLNDWRIQLYLLNQAGDTLKSLRYKGESKAKGQFSIGSLDLRDLEAGNYKLRARAATAWSKMKLKDIIFEIDHKGERVAMPGTLLPPYAELFNNASATTNAISFKPSTADTDYATWNVSFAKAGAYNVSIDVTAKEGNDHKYGVSLYSADGLTKNDSVGGTRKGNSGVIKLGVITVPTAGNYTIKLTNNLQWSEAVLHSITIAPKTLYLSPGVWNVDGAKFAIWDITNSKWSDFMTVAENETNVYTTTIDANATQVIFVRLNNSAETPNWDKKDNQTADLDLQDGKDLYTITGWGASDGNWSIYEPPYIPILENGYYLVGDFAGVPAWGYADLTAAKKFHVNPDNADEQILENVTLAVDDSIKVVYLENDVIQWYSPNESNYVVDANHAGVKTIYFRPAGGGGEGWFYNVLFIEANGTTPTGIDETNATVKAFKTIENGQIIIIKNGVRYNVLGQIEK